MEPNERTYDQLTDNQRVQVDRYIFSADKLLGVDSRQYIYTLGNHSHNTEPGVLCRRKMTRVERESLGA